MAGHTVVDASSGEDALTVLGSAPFDAIVLDAAQPDMSVTEAIDRLRATAGDPPIPIIAMADAELDSTTLAALAGTPTTRVPKPCTPHELTDAVARAVAAAEHAPVERIRLPDAQEMPQRQP